MSQQRLTMRQIREVLRLKNSLGFSDRQIAKMLQISKTTVSTYLSHAKVAGISWPIDESLSDSSVYQKLFPSEAPSVSTSRKPLPDFHWIHLEKKKKGVTLLLLWEEYRVDHPDGYSYTQFWEYYRQWSRTLNLSMRQDHRAGEKLFIDYSGDRILITDPKTGEQREAELFVSVLGASSYTYAEASSSQTLPDWTASHVRAFEYFGGAPELLIPDNLKSGVNKPCRYEPLINATYQEMAAYYGCAVIPARVRKPKDKAKVEGGVLLVQRWILAVLRHQIFYSLHEANAAIFELLKKLNSKKMQKIKKSRRELFEALDQPVLKPLPLEPYRFTEFKTARVNIDYHIEVDEHYYSVPCTFSGKLVEARFSGSFIEIFFDGKRIASHPRSHASHRHSTTKEHMPKSHQRYVEWTPSRILHWGESIDPSFKQLFESILKSRPHPEQGYRACLGIIRLEKNHGKERLILAVKKAIFLRSYSYQTVKRILKNRLESVGVPEEESSLLQIPHENLRGKTYYGGNHDAP